MKPIQFILVPLLILLLIIFIPRLRQQRVLKIIFILIITAIMVFTIFLDSSMVLAQYLGIGRGVDLVMYFGMLGLSVCCLLLYLRMQQLQQQLTELARQMALRGTTRKPEGTRGEGRRQTVDGRR